MLLVLPPIMFLVMRFVNRPYADVLLEHTGLLAAMMASMGRGSAVDTQDHPVRFLINAE